MSTLSSAPRPRPSQSSSARVEPLAVVHVRDILEPAVATQWLVEDLWSLEGVGILGAAPKSLKTWLALDLAVSVASGTPVLGRFPVLQPGKALVYAAEDSLEGIRNRISDITKARNLSLQDIDLGLITVPSLRLDSPREVERLGATLDLHRPQLLVLDPLVRIHKLDENSANDISSLLGDLRTIQREHHVAVLLVHHLRKNGASSSQPGQALRGSGDLHAWGDTNLYLRRTSDSITLSIEHRFAASPQCLHFTLATNPSPHLELCPGDAVDPEPGIDDRLLQLLTQAAGPVDRETLRQNLHTRNQNLGLSLVRLRQQGRIDRCAGGFQLRRNGDFVPVPLPASGPERNAPPPM